MPRKKLPSWQYPTAKDILEHSMPIRKDALKTVKLWKLSHKRLNNEIALLDLIGKLSDCYGVKVKVEFTGNYAQFSPQTNTITLVNRSILTALHEFAHKVFGASEFTACRWSAWLFMKAFPERMRKMEWKGHLLVAKKPNANSIIRTA